MIIDNIENAELYKGIGAGIHAALEYLAKKDFSALAPGRYDIEGDHVFALVQKYETRPRNKGIWEAHRKFIDVQYIAAGIELMGYAPTGKLALIEPYTAEKDVVLMTGEGDFLTARPGMFFIFFPGDAHMPGIARDKPAAACKVVIKVAVDSLGSDKN